MSQLAHLKLGLLALSFVFGRGVPVTSQRFVSRWGHPHESSCPPDFCSKPKGVTNSKKTTPKGPGACRSPSTPSDCNGCQKHGILEDPQVPGFTATHQPGANNISETRFNLAVFTMLHLGSPHPSPKKMFWTPRAPKDPANHNLGVHFAEGLQVHQLPILQGLRHLAASLGQFLGPEKWAKKRSRSDRAPEKPREHHKNVSNWKTQEIGGVSEAVSQLPSTRTASNPPNPPIQTTKVALSGLAWWFGGAEVGFPIQPLQRVQVPTHQPTMS